MNPAKAKNSMISVYYVKFTQHQLLRLKENFHYPFTACSKASGWKPVIASWRNAFYMLQGQPVNIVILWQWNYPILVKTHNQDITRRAEIPKGRIIFVQNCLTTN